MTSRKSDQDPAFITAQIADEACYMASEDMLSANGRSQPKQFRGRLDEHRQNIKMLSGKSIEFELNGIDEHDQSRYFKSIIGNDLKVCLDCVRESSCPIEHSYIYSTHCSKHEVKLISACSCGHELSWDHALLNGVCSSCGEELSPTYEKVSEHQRFIECADEEDKADIIWDLCRAASYVLRPSDSTPELIHYDKLPQNTDLFEEAYKLLTDRNFFSKWLTFLSSNRKHYAEPLGNYAVFAPVFELIRQLKSSWPIFIFSASIQRFDRTSGKTTEYGVKYFAPRPKWKKHGLTTDEQNLLARDKANLDTIANILGLEVREASALITQIELNPLNGYRRNGNLYFRLSELKELFISHCFDSVDCYFLDAMNCDFVNATDFSDALASFMVDRNDLLSWVLSNEVAGEIIKGNETLYQRLKASAFQATRKMHKHLYSKAPEKLSKDEVLKVFHLTELDIKDLNVNGKLYPLKWQQSLTSYYKVEDFILLDKKSFNFRRYCALRNIDFDAEVEKLRNLKIEALYGTSIFQCRYQVLFALRYGEFIEAKTKSEKPETPPSNPLWFTLGIQPLR